MVQELLVSAAPGAFRFRFDEEGVLVGIVLPRPVPAGADSEAYGTPRGAPEAARVRSWLRQVLAGRPTPFPGRWRMPGRTPFTRSVYQEVAAIPAGAMRSYREVAARCGVPGAARAVGNAMARNPLPLVIPCHRVVAAAGLGGYGGGLELKADLLRRESALAARG